MYDAEQPKNLVNWLALAEFLYNTNYHTAINKTPFEVVYGQSSPTHVSYMASDSKVEAVDRSLSARGSAISLLQFQQEKAQHSLKTYTDKGGLKGSLLFEIGSCLIYSHTGKLH